MQTLSFKNLDITSTTKGKLPSLPFVELKEEILGKAFDLSISFVSPAKMATLSQIYKGDPTHMNVLAFPLDAKSGEIVMNLSEIKKESIKFNQTYKKHLLFIVIHGMLHLAHHVHGSRMELAEKRLFSKFSS